MDSATEKERDAQKHYWLEHTPANPTVETMMLDSKASEIDQLERPEVLGLLGSVKGKRVLELGAGIGRFTGELCAAGAAHVLALDFMQASIEQNRRQNGHHSNVEFRVEDATLLQLPDESYDVIFSNWLLMYLSDEEVQDLAARMIRWVAPGGVLFFRESCFKQSGDKPRKGNPTHYRNPREYFTYFDAVTCPAPAAVPEASTGSYHWHLLFCKCVDTYVRVKQNQNQICWKWEKTSSSAPPASPDQRPQHHEEELRHFLDTQQYTAKGVAAYEAVYGHGYMSCGGHTTTQELAPLLRLQPGQNVLDVGCGTGGNARWLSEHLQVAVHGLDLSVTCLLTALERGAGERSNIVFEVADVTRRDLAPSSYHAIYCRDTMLHVEDKQQLLERFHHWLTPGGRLLITDYALACPNNTSSSNSNGSHSSAAQQLASHPVPVAEDGSSSTAAAAAPASSHAEQQQWQDSMASYCQSRKYHLWDPEQYRQGAAAAGFGDVEVRDLTQQLVHHLERELSELQSHKDAFIAQLGQQAYEASEANWVAKLGRARAGVQRWVLLTATK